MDSSDAMFKFGQSMKLNAKGKSEKGSNPSGKSLRRSDSHRLKHVVTAPSEDYFSCNTSSRVLPSTMDDAGYGTSKWEIKNLNGVDKEGQDQPGEQDPSLVVLYEMKGRDNTIATTKWSASNNNSPPANCSKKMRTQDRNKDSYDDFTGVQSSMGVPERKMIYNVAFCKSVDPLPLEFDLKPSIAKTDHSMEYNQSQEELFRKPSSLQRVTSLYQQSREAEALKKIEIEEKKQENLEKKQSDIERRKSNHKAYSRRTQYGQPLMAGRINKMLEKIQSSTELLK